MIFNDAMFETIYIFKMFLNDFSCIVFKYIVTSVLNKLKLVSSCGTEWGLQLV